MKIFTLGLFTLLLNNIFAGPSLDDLFKGKARFQTINESQQIRLKFDSSIRHIWDQKLPILFNEMNKKYYSFTRAKTDNPNFQIIMLESQDGVSFKQVGSPLFSYMNEWTLYDPHISYSKKRSAYIMTMECAKILGKNRFGASLCVSISKNPFNKNSWSRPKLVIQNAPLRSASTGVSVEFKGKEYISWTLVNDGQTSYVPRKNAPINPEDGNESTSSKINQLYFKTNSNIPVYLGRSNATGKFILKAKSDPYCSYKRGAKWDCNNLDIQDLKVEGNYLYAIYNGGNYYRCKRPVSDRVDFQNNWAISIRRTRNALSNYNEGTGVLINNISNDICGISYPVINKINGETYLYYSYYKKLPSGSHQNFMARSKLIYGRPLNVTNLTKNKNIRNFVPTATDKCVEQIENLYLAFLDRYPNKIEINNWYNNAKNHRDNIKNVVKGVMLSREAKNIWNKRNIYQNVQALYHGILLRPADSTGLKSFSQQLKKDNNILKSNLYNKILNSPEFRNIANQNKCVR